MGNVSEASDTAVQALTIVNSTADMTTGGWRMLNLKDSLFLNYTLTVICECRILNNMNLLTLCFSELNQMTGVAAILRFPMPEIEEADME